MVEVNEMRLDLKDDKEFKDAIRVILNKIDNDPNREGLERTPIRVAKAFEEWFGGYAIKDPEEILDRTFPSEGYDDIIAVPNIEFDSFCEHHITPIRGRAHVFYIPNGKIIGLDKLIKLVYMYAKRLQTQEVMTQQIGDAMKKHLDASGVYVYVEGKHNCVATRGTMSRSSSMVNTYRSGLFKEKFELENKALKIIEISKKEAL